VIGEAFHVGVVVPQIESAIAAMAPTVGYEWTEPRQFDRLYSTRKGQLQVTMRAVFSRSGPVRVELIDAIEGTPWEQVGMHHIGHWTDDLAADAATLESKGFPPVAQGRDEAGRLVRTSMHVGPIGYIELVDTAMRSQLEAWWGRDQQHLTSSATRRS
jgi:hypothetical protein